MLLAEAERKEAMESGPAKKPSSKEVHVIDTDDGLPPIMPPELLMLFQKRKFDLGPVLMAKNHSG